MKVLAVGGPAHGKMMENIGPEMIVPLEMPAASFVMEPLTPQDMIYDLQVGKYNLRTLGDPDTGARRKVYVYQDVKDPTRELQDLLLKMFVNEKSYVTIS